MSYCRQYHNKYYPAGNGLTSRPSWGVIYLPFLLYSVLVIVGSIFSITLFNYLGGIGMVLFPVLALPYALLSIRKDALNYLALLIFGYAVVINSMIAGQANMIATLKFSLLPFLFVVIVNSYLPDISESRFRKKFLILVIAVIAVAVLIGTTVMHRG